jgi:hypothetical protein
MNRFIGPLVCVVVLVVLAPVAVQAQGIETRRESMSDTEFIPWLVDHAPSDSTARRTRWRILTGSDQISNDSKLIYYREWTSADGELPRPEDQIVTAVRTDEMELAREWLDRWLRDGNLGFRDYRSMADALVDARQLEWAAEVIRTAQERGDALGRLFRRMAAIQQTLGHPEQALEQYLEAYQRFRGSDYIRSKINTLLLNNDVDETLFEFVKRRTKNGTTKTYLLNLVEDYLIDTGRVEELIDWVSRLYDSGDSEVIRVREIIDRIMDRKDYREARELSSWVLKQRRSNEHLLRHARLQVWLNEPDSAARIVDSLDTPSLSDTQWTERGWVMAAVSIHRGDHDTVPRYLERLGKGPGADTLWLEWYQVRNRYDSVIHYLNRRELDRPGLRFLTLYKTGTIHDTLLQQLVKERYRQPRTALALSLAGTSDSAPGRSFMRWLDRVPFDRSIDTGLPKRFVERSDHLPTVLLDRWYRQLKVVDWSADRMVGLGRSLGYPPLMLEGARRYRETDRPGTAIQVLEEILIEHPETMLRSRVEALLNRLS